MKPWNIRLPIAFVLVAATTLVAAQESHQQAAPRRGGRGIPATEQATTDGETTTPVTDQAVAELVAWKTDEAGDLLDGARDELGTTAEFKAAEGLQLYSQGKIQQAIDRLEAATAALVSDPMPPYFLSRILRDERQYDDAEDAVGEAHDRAATRVAANPKDARAQYYLGATSVEMKKINKARTALTAASEGGFDARLCGYQLGLSHALAKEWQKAKGAFDAVLERDPRFAPAYLHRGLTWSKLGRNDKMATDLERFLELAPDSPDADTARAMLGAYRG